MLKSGQHTPVNSQFPVILILQLILNVLLYLNYCTEVSNKKLLDTDNVTTSKGMKITKKQNFLRLITSRSFYTLCLHLSMNILNVLYSKKIIGLRIIISRIIHT